MGGHGEKGQELEVRARREEEEKGNGDLLHEPKVDYTTTGNGNSALCTVSCAGLHGIRQADPR